MISIKFTALGISLRKRNIPLYNVTKGLGFRLTQESKGLEEAYDLKSLAKKPY